VLYICTVWLQIFFLSDLTENCMNLILSCLLRWYFSIAASIFIFKDIKINFTLQQCINFSNILWCILLAMGLPSTPSCYRGIFPFVLSGRNLAPQFFREHWGRAIAQVVSRWFRTAAARVRSQVRSCGICGGQSGIEAGFLRVLQCPLPILIPPTAP
jgi:hypothetical protein